MHKTWSASGGREIVADGGTQPRARPRDRGAALVELAFALPLLVMLIVGMVSSGIAFNHQLALTHAAREGGRYAATLPVTNFGSIDAWLADVVAQTEADATGTLASTAPGRYVCVAYVHPNGTTAQDSTARRISNSSGLQATQLGQQCFTDGRPNDERRVQVEVRRDTDFSVVFFSSTITLDAEGVNRFEAALGS